MRAWSAVPEFIFLRATPLKAGGGCGGGFLECGGARICVLTMGFADPQGVFGDIGEFGES